MKSFHWPPLEYLPWTVTIRDASMMEVKEVISEVKSCFSCVLYAAVGLLILFDPFIIRLFISHCCLLVDLGRDLYFIDHRSHLNFMAC